MGMASDENISDLSNIVKKYGDKFGGVFIWEYCLAKPTPLEWLNNMNKLLNSTNDNDEIPEEIMDSIKNNIANIIQTTFKHIEENSRCTIV